MIKKFRDNSKERPLKEKFSTKAPRATESQEDIYGRKLLEHLQGGPDAVDAAFCLSMIELNATLSFEKNKGWDAMMMASGFGLADVVKAGLDKGYRLDQQSENYLETALHTALFGYMNFLIDTGSDRNDKRDYPKTLEVMLTSDQVRSNAVRLDVKTRGGIEALEIMKNLFKKGIVRTPADKKGVKTEGVRESYALFAREARRQRDFFAPKNAPVNS